MVYLQTLGNLILIFVVFEPSKINYARGLLFTDQKPKIAETQIYQGKSSIEVNPLSRNGLSLFC